MIVANVSPTEQYAYQISEPEPFTPCVFLLVYRLLGPYFGPDILNVMCFRNDGGRHKAKL